MKKQLIIRIIQVIILILVFVAFHFSVNMFLKFDQVIKDHVGDRLIINKDTLIIMDYSILNETYTLSDKNKISFELLDHIENKGKKK